MPRKVKIPIQAMEDIKPEPRPMSGSSICAVCRKEIDKCCEDMEGSGYLSKAAEKVEKVSRKGASKVKKAGKATGKYITSTEANDGLASDLLTYGLPAATGATLGAVGALGGPLAGVAASALGSKLGALAGEEIKGEVLKEGSGMKRKPRFAKGSQEAKDYMKSLREKRQKK